MRQEEKKNVKRMNETKRKHETGIQWCYYVMSLRIIVNQIKIRIRFFRMRKYPQISNTIFSVRPCRQDIRLVMNNIFRIYCVLECVCSVLCFFTHREIEHIWK